MLCNSKHRFTLALCAHVARSIDSFMPVFYICVVYIVNTCRLDVRECIMCTHYITRVFVCTYIV